MYFVYILYSENFDTYYKGYTTNIVKRVEQHNQNKSEYTSGKGPWELVYLKQYEDKKQVLIEEKRLKRLNRRSVEKLIQDSNE